MFTYSCRLFLSSCGTMNVLRSNGPELSCGGICVGTVASPRELSPVR